MRSLIVPGQATPKKTLAAEKETSILKAAQEHFLRQGFSAASMDAIAASAGVSVKTIYGHFDNKEALFNQVMVAACTDHLLTGQLPSDDVLEARFPWFAKATQKGMEGAGITYLGHLLSAQQLSLYRVVTQDAARFPELGRQYQKNFAKGRTAILIAYMKRMAQKRGWPRRDLNGDAFLYEALLRARIFEEVLQGLLVVSDELIEQQARWASRAMWRFLSSETE